MRHAMLQLPRMLADAHSHGSDDLFVEAPAGTAELTPLQ